MCASPITARLRAIATKSHNVSGVPRPPITAAQYNNAIGEKPTNATADASASDTKITA